MIIVHIIKYVLYHYMNVLYDRYIA